MKFLFFPSVTAEIDHQSHGTEIDDYYENQGGKLQSADFIYPIAKVIK